jgi:hypothetical protein
VVAAEPIRHRAPTMVRRRTYQSRHVSRLYPANDAGVPRDHARARSASRERRVTSPPTASRASARSRSAAASRRRSAS